eukprot:756683-Hanusia_phi.AAC.2
MSLLPSAISFLSLPSVPGEKTLTRINEDKTSREGERRRGGRQGSGEGGEGREGREGKGGKGGKGG